VAAFTNSAYKHLNVAFKEHRTAVAHFELKFIIGYKISVGTLFLDAMFTSDGKFVIYSHSQKLYKYITW
jgi:hypothetical protein